MCLVNSIRGCPYIIALVPSAPSSVSGVEIYGGGFWVSHACARHEKTGADSVTSFWSTLIGLHTPATLGCWPGS